MAYAIEREESVHDAVARVMTEQIARARNHLTGDESPAQSRIHETRKRFKETRAVLRLVREPLGAQFAVENAWFRDAGRELAVARDAEAVIESLETLAGTITPPLLRRARRALEKRRDAVNAAELEGSIANVIAQLDAALTRIAGWPALGTSFDALERGLLRTYRAGRRAMKRASRVHSPDEMHAWRKRVKEHWYHVQLLRHVWPTVMKSYAAVMQDLSRALGDHHDLFVLRGIVASAPAEFGKTAAVVALLDAIDLRQRELEREAAAIGARIYAEAPRAWLARMRNYWSAWRAT